MVDCHGNLKQNINALNNLLVELGGFADMRIDFRIPRKGLWLRHAMLP